MTRTDFHRGREAVAVLAGRRAARVNGAATQRSRLRVLTADLTARCRDLPDLLRRRTG